MAYKIYKINKWSNYDTGRRDEIIFQFKNYILIAVAFILIASLPFQFQQAESASSTLKQGDSESAVQELQKDLNEAGFHVTDNPTTYFGSKTDEAVRDFQRVNELVVDGVAGPNTLNELEEVLIESREEESSNSNSGSEVLEDGVSSDAAQAMKEDLHELGYLDIADPNDHFGPQTEEAVMAFQDDRGLSADGVADDDTLGELSDALSTGDSSGDSKVLEDGVRSDAAQAMKEDLHELGYLDIADPNDRFGPQTEEAVMAFQDDHGLSADGVADDDTLGELSDARSAGAGHSSGDSEVLEDGVRSDAAQAMKEDLHELGYLDIADPNDHFGPQSEEAVMAFQEDRGLTADGVADDDTLGELSDARSTGTDDSEVLEDGVSSDAAQAMKEDLHEL
ncbi:peptidoglycan-binding domain-containing protein, partial [Marinococcus luteus]|uniref:peptidoglycan-binding domain-containing protein n=1 Tax=Marinococcus luteus TaxID=1122204 RepID=UPI002ACC7B70